MVNRPMCVLTASIPSDLRDLLPRDKMDTANAEALVALGYPAVDPLLPELIQWLQDMNWPVAPVLARLLQGIGMPMVPVVRHVLYSDDDIWKYWVIRSLIVPSIDLRRELRPELERMAHRPTPNETRELVNEAAQEALLGKL